MITTLPGLYLATVGIVKPLGTLFSIPVSTLCSTFWLRSVNVFFATGNLYLLYRLVKKLHQSDKVIHFIGGSFIHSMIVVCVYMNVCGGGEVLPASPYSSKVFFVN